MSTEMTKVKRLLSSLQPIVLSTVICVQLGLNVTFVISSGQDDYSDRLI